MKIRKICLIIVSVAIILSIAAAIGFLAYISPPKDEVEVLDYDEQYIYLADPIAESANASDAQYNRVLTTEDFEAIWKNGTLLPDNIYIVVKIRTDNL